MLVVSHKIRLKPTKLQQVFLAQCCGITRFVYNWGLENWKKSFDFKEKTSWMKLDKQLNSIKEDQFSWMCEVPSCICQQALSHLGSAMSNFFKKAAKFPVFKKKGVSDSFTLTNTVGKLIGNKLQLSKAGISTIRG